MNYHHIKAKIICDSIYNEVPRLITFELTYPRYIHSEFMTHRQFSRNASSSRAIPTSKLIEKVRNDPVMPIRWGRNQSGMQAKNENLDPRGQHDCEDLWCNAAKYAADVCEALSGAGLHKQWANRITEPFSTITVICTATEYENFFALRCHKDAQPEIYDLAWKMADLYYTSKPEVTDKHLPYVTLGDMLDVDQKLLPMVSAARCARVSYLNHDGSTPNIEKDLDLANKLRTSGHMSPFEHQAIHPYSLIAGTEYKPSNLRGWVQYRKLLPTEVQKFDYVKALLERA